MHLHTCTMPWTMPLTLYLHYLLYNFSGSKIQNLGKVTKENSKIQNYNELQLYRIQYCRCRSQILEDKDGSVLCTMQVAAACASNVCQTSPSYIYLRHIGASLHKKTTVIQLINLESRTITQKASQSFFHIRKNTVIVHTPTRNQ